MHQLSVSGSAKDGPVSKSSSKDSMMAPAHSNRSTTPLVDLLASLMNAGVLVVSLYMVKYTVQLKNTFLSAHMHDVMCCHFRSSSVHWAVQGPDRQAWKSDRRVSIALPPGARSLSNSRRQTPLHIRW